MIWRYGVVTVPSRFDTYLPNTLASLKAAGFPEPRLFVDRAEECGRFLDNAFGLHITYRRPALNAYGNWALAVMELYLRDPLADRYAIFQDDLLAVRNLREYLDCCAYPDHGYWNLYEFPSEKLPVDRKGWYESPLMGKGALGYVFNRHGMITLLSQQHFVARAQEDGRGKKNIDGGVFECMRNAGWKEYLHSPSLLFHTGKVTSLHEHSRDYPDADFRGADFDAMELLKV